MNVEKYARLKKKWLEAPESMMTFWINDFEDSMLTEQEASALDYSDVKMQDTLYVHMTTCLGLV